MLYICQPMLTEIPVLRISVFLLQSNFHLNCRNIFSHENFFLQTVQTTLPGCHGGCIEAAPKHQESWRTTQGRNSWRCDSVHCWNGWNGGGRLEDRTVSLIVRANVQVKKNQMALLDAWHIPRLVAVYRADAVCLPGLYTWKGSQAFWAVCWF